ncbi:MAG: ABC transporter permease [bacterium]|nr:ABC transporter permease [bacterium]
MKLPHYLISLQSIVRTEIIRFTRIWSQTLLPPVITQSLYFIIFGGFIGSQISDIKGVSYMAFLVPGLIMMGVINGAFQNVVSSVFGAKFMHSIEELLVSPTPNWVILFGYTLGGVLRGLLVGIIIFGVSAVFVHPQINHPWIVLLFALLTSTIFALGGFLNGIFAKKFDDVAIFPIFVLTPLTYFGGVFYSIDLLPSFWQTISKLNPILYIVDGFRYGFYSIADVPIFSSVIALLIFIVILSVINLTLLKKGVGMKQ